MKTILKKLPFISRILTSQLRINMVALIGTNVANFAIAGISYPVYLYFLGYDIYGVWLLLATVISIARTANLGIDSAVMKLVAEEYGRGNLSKIEKYVTTAIFILCISGSIVLLSIILSSQHIISFFNLSKEHAEIMALFLPYMGLLSIYVFIVQVISATLSGLGRIDLISFSDSSGRLLGLCVSIILLMTGRGVESLFVGNLLSYIIVNITNLYFLRRIARLQLLNLKNFDLECLKRLIRFGSGMVGSSLIVMMMGPFNKIVMSRYIGVAAVPIYEIAYQGAMQIRSLLGASFRALSPEISRISAETSTDISKKINRINHKATMLIWKLGTPTFLFFMIFATPLLKIWLRGRFENQLPATFQLILFGTFISLLCVPAYYILMGLGRTKAIFIGQAIQSCINASLILVVVLIGIDLSINMFAVAVTVAMIVTAIYFIWQKKVAINQIA